MFRDRAEEERDAPFGEKLCFFEKLSGLLANLPRRTRTPKAEHPFAPPPTVPHLNAAGQKGGT
jgi:hypothetical protein